MTEPGASVSSQISPSAAQQSPASQVSPGNGQSLVVEHSKAAQNENSVSMKFVPETQASSAAQSVPVSQAASSRQTPDTNPLANSSGVMLPAMHASPGAQSGPWTDQLQASPADGNVRQAGTSNRVGSHTSAGEQQGNSSHPRPLVQHVQSELHPMR